MPTQTIIVCGYIIRKNSLLEVDVDMGIVLIEIKKSH